MRKQLTVVFLSLLLVSCGRHGYWNSLFNSWHESCPNFPTLEEAETVLKEQAALIERGLYTLVAKGGGGRNSSLISKS